MNENSKTAANETAKTVMFNLIILDESGSMRPMTKETISGCNELINTIKSTKESCGDMVKSLVSIYAFQTNDSVPSRYLVKNADPDKVSHITEKDYIPFGCTPLLDAVGSTLSELKAVSETHEDATGTITIMTDGLENSSRHYTWEKVAQLISWFKEMGWTVNLIGANIDVEMMAKHMSIDAENTLEYNQTSEGTKQMWRSMACASAEAIKKERLSCKIIRNPEERRKARRIVSKDFFK